MSSGGAHDDTKPDSKESTEPKGTATPSKDQTIINTSTNPNE